MNKAVLDTNILMSHSNLLEKLTKEYKIILPFIVVEELDNLKMNRDEDKSYKAREALKQIDKYLDSIDIQENKLLSGLIDKNDNIIISCAVNNSCLLFTDDLAMRIKASKFNIDCKGFLGEEINTYKGYTEVNFDEFQLANFYETKFNNWGLLENQYLIIRDLEGNYTDVYKWTKDGFKELTKKSLKSTLFGDKIKPKDTYQEMAIDSLVNDKFTILTGKAGSGKSLLSLMYCMWAIQNNKYDKLIIMFNPTKTRGAVDMGFYGGNVVEKALQQNIGHILNTKFGDPMYVDTMIKQGKLQLIPMSDCRGMEVTDHQILYVSEAQNLTKDLARIVLSRASKDAKIILEGDVDNQVDSKFYESNNNGLRRTIEVFKGEDMFSYVHLKNVYRSRIADISDKM